MMQTSRIEAFTDAVIAIIITIMILELKVPQGITLTDLMPLKSIALCYVLSFIYLATYWNSHHHLFQVVKEVNGVILWSNFYLLFWLTLIPFVTAWAGEHHFANIPTVLYGFVLLMASCAYTILTRVVIVTHADHDILAPAIGRDIKGKVSMVLYTFAMILAYWHPYVAFAIYILVAGMWFTPDPRIEKLLKH